MNSVHIRHKPSSAREPFNVVVIIVDALRPDLPEYGYDREISAGASRHLESAVRFLNCYSTTGWTLPGCATILTGLHPEQHGLVDHNSRFQVPKLGHFLGDPFHRIGIANNGNMVSDRIFIERLEEIGHKKRPKKWNHFGWDDGFDQYLWTHRRDHETPFRQANNFLKDGSSKPFFLFLHTNIVHDYSYDYDYYLSATRWLANPLNEALREFPDGPPIWRENVEGLDLNEKSTQIRAKYDAGVDYAFQKIGDLLDLVDFEETIVALVSDHGEGFDPQAGRVHHCGRLHQDLLRVPLFLWLPEKLRRRFSVPDEESRLCSTVDLVPTVLRLLGDNIDGFPGVFLLDLPTHRSIESSDSAYVYWDEDLVRQSYDECRIELRSTLRYPLKAISYRRDDEHKYSFFNLLYDPDERENQMDWAPPEGRRPISFVVAVNDDEELRHNLLSSPIAADPFHQWILVDNKRNRHFKDITRLYNEALEQAQNELVFFFHQDVYLPAGWESQLHKSLRELEAEDLHWGVIGAVGRLAPVDGHKGKVIGRSCDPHQMYSAPSFPFEVQCLDEQWIGIRKSSGLKFDGNLPGFHCYGIDLSLSARRQGMKSYIVDAFVWHKYRDRDGSFIDCREKSEKIVTRRTRRFRRAFQQSIAYVSAKWRDYLPVNSTSYLFTEADLSLPKKGAWRSGK
jgi:arylsulfatase A-like enzyme